jgi:glycosyltransferase involved in cell wall biosynthesis
LDWYNRNADLVIVTNQNHALRVERLGGRPYVCPDPLPEFAPPAATRVQVADRSVLLVCSFDVDEPYLEAFEAFRSLQAEGFTLYVSGNYRRSGIAPERYPWVRFLGFVDEDIYYDYFRSCALVMDLTTCEDCLVCGAYEAMALRRPLVLSDTLALSGYFGKACVLTANTATAIAASVRAAFQRRETLADQTGAWVGENKSYMDERVRTLEAALDGLAGR